MNKIKKIMWLCGWVLLFFYPSLVNARVSPAAAPVGSVVIIGGRTYVKITKTNLWMDASKWDVLGNTTMQGWDDCASLATPTGTNFTQGPTLIDARDNKIYEIRKFSDGKCWMVDNLMYGGDTDACAGKTTFAGNGSATASNRFGANTFGDCRDPRVGGAAPCTAGSTTCGYYYNWQAAMQHSTAWYNTTYTGPTTNVQGLCPEGWRLPTGGASGDFAILHSAVGSPATGFWQGGNWKGPFSGYCGWTGGLDSQGSYGYWWSSTPYSATYAYYMYFVSSAVGPSNYNSHKYYGYTVRCLKN